MTPAQQAQLEQVAREWLLRNGYCLNHSPDGDTEPYYGELQSLITLLATQRVAAMEEAGERNRELEKNYYELIMHVSAKHPDETRHQTALRYIRQAENRGNTPCAQQAQEQRP